MGLTNMQPFKRLPSGKFVKPFPSGGIPEPAASLGSAYASACALVDATLAKAEAINSDERYSPAGRKAALRDWFEQEAAPVMKRCREAMAKADSDLGALKASMATSAIDKSDLAGALLRQETRTWLRGLEPAQRAGLLAVEADPLIVQAVIEGPAALSGVSDRQRAALEAQAVAAAHPAEMTVVNVTEEALQATVEAEQAAVATLRDAMALTGAEFDEALGGPSQLDLIRARLGGPTSGAADAAPILAADS